MKVQKEGDASKVQSYWHLQGKGKLGETTYCAFLTLGDNEV
jgi:hypothetical protein